MPAENQHTPAPSNKRIIEVDALRGLIMLIMAIDHASFFIRKVHFSESWGLSIPAYRGWAEFFTRYITHLAPTGFFILMGMGIAFSKHKRSTMDYVLRACFILVLHLIFEQRLWNSIVNGSNPSVFRFGRIPGFGGTINYELGVLFALSISLMFWGILRNTSNKYILPTSVFFLILPMTIIPKLFTTSAPSLIMQLLFIPWRGNGISLLYPVFPWIGLCGLGVWLGNHLKTSPISTLALFTKLGLLLIILFPLMKMTGLGSFYDAITPSQDLMAFLSVVKYPASPAFISLMTGIILFLLRGAIKFSDRLAPLLRQLSYIGKEPLFFYFAHLSFYALLSPEFPNGATLKEMYFIWLLSIPVLYVLCRLWHWIKIISNQNKGLH